MAKKMIIAVFNETPLRTDPSVLLERGLSHWIFKTTSTSVGALSRLFSVKRPQIVTLCTAIITEYLENSAA